nr:MAG TPA: hypothetical protein [Caudoviricetes sp.]
MIGLVFKEGERAAFDARLIACSTDLITMLRKSRDVLDKAIDRAKTADVEPMTVLVEEIDALLAKACGERHA